MKKQKFAKMIGVSPQTLSKILSGGKYQTSIRTAEKMAKLLGYKNVGRLVDLLFVDPCAVSESIKALPE